MSGNGLLKYLQVYEEEWKWVRRWVGKVRLLGLEGEGVIAKQEGLANVGVR